MGLLKKYETNESAEIDGVVFECPDAANNDGSIPWFKLARMGGRNSKFNQVYAEAWKPHRALQQANKVPKEVTERVSIEVFVDGLLRGYGNVQEENGVTIGYTREAAIAFFLRVPELAGELQAKATEREPYLKHATEIAEKN